jgi:hypothetical protein
LNTITKATNEMHAIQAEINALYREYRAISAEMARHSNQLKLIEQVSLVTDIIRGGIAANDLISTDGRSASGDQLPPDSDTRDFMEWNNEKFLSRRDEA